MRNTIIKSDSMRELLRLPKPIPPGDPAEFISKVAQLVDDLEFAEAAPDEARATIQNVLATSFVDLTPERIPVIMLPVALHLARLYDGDTAQSMFAVFSLIDVSLARSAKVVATLCRRIISELALDAFTSERLLRAALLADIGKILAPPSNDFARDFEHWPENMQHAAMGADYLESSASLASLLPIVRTHHRTYAEWAASGDTDEAWPIEARVISLAIAWRQLLSRPIALQGATPVRRALDIIKAEAENIWDPRVAGALERALLEAPSSRPDSNNSGA